MSGAVALLLTANGDLSPAAVETVLKSSTDPLDWVETGRIDASVLLDGGVADLKLERNKASARTINLSGQYRGDVVRVDLVVYGDVTDTDSYPADGTFSLVWDARGVEPRLYQLQVDAIDGAGGATRSRPLTLQIISGTNFTDVVRNAFYEDAVGWMVADAITNGTSPATFSPNDHVTRGQLATFLWRFAGKPPASAPAAFSDTSPTAFYADGVGWMVAEGITTGTSPTTFSPNGPVTRGQLAAFLFRFAGTATASQASFSDVGRGAYYAEAVDCWWPRESPPARARPRSHPTAR